jgi:hypothetical protein
MPAMKGNPGEGWHQEQIVHGTGEHTVRDLDTARALGAQVSADSDGGHRIVSL